MGTVAGGLAESLDLSSLGLPGMSFPGFGGPPGELNDEDDDSDYDSDYDSDDEEDDDEDDDEEEDADEIVQIDAPDPLPGQGQLPPAGAGHSPSGRGEA